jgi:hypothetical protein
VGCRRSLSMGGHSFTGTLPVFIYTSTKLTYVNAAVALQRGRVVGYGCRAAVAAH